MCCDEGWEDLWLVWGEPRDRVLATPLISEPPDTEVGAAVRAAAELMQPRKARAPALPVLRAWLQLRFAHSPQPEPEKQLALLDRR